MEYLNWIPASAPCVDSVMKYVDTKKVTTYIHLSHYKSLQEERIFSSSYHLRKIRIPSKAADPTGAKQVSQAHCDNHQLKNKSLFSNTAVG